MYNEIYLSGEFAKLRVVIISNKLQYF